MSMRRLWVNWILGICSLVWGVILYFPGDSLQANPAYQISFLNAPEYIWSVVLVVLSLVFLATKNLWTNLIYHGFCFSFWNFLLFLIFAGGPIKEASFLIATPFAILSLLHFGEFIDNYSRLRGNGE